MDGSTLVEAALPGSSLMDTGIDGDLDPNMEANMDDLFGEAADGSLGLTAENLAIPLPSAPLPRTLVLGIAEMQSIGCNTQLAYSNTGSIAQIRDRGRKIVFRALIRNVSTGEWTMTEESSHPILASEGATWKHMQFNNIGVDMAAVDSYGHVHIYTLTGALGKMPEAPSNITRSETSSELDAVVGLHWIPVYPAEIRFPYISPTSKSGERWTSAMRHRDVNEVTVHHAMDGRQALLYVTRDAKLTLMFQIEQFWHAKTFPLDDVYSSDELLSHAAMCEDGDNVLLATHDLAKRIRLYQVKIDWNPSQQARPGGGPTVSLVAPELKISHLTALDHVCAHNADGALLSQLRFVPRLASHAIDPNSMTFPTVLAVFVSAALPGDLTQQHHEPFSIIARWHVETTVPTLHEAFGKLKANGAATAPSKTITILRRQEDIITTKVILSTEAQCFNTILAFACSDGSIEFRNGGTLTPISPFPDPTNVSSLPQSGFEQLMDADHFLHVAMSTDGSVMATVRPDNSGTFGHKLMTPRYTWAAIQDDSGLFEAAIECLARQYSLLACTSMANDETLALLPLDLSTEKRTFFIKEIIRLLNRTLDISMQDTQRQQMSVVREPLLPKAMSAQLILGTTPGTTSSTGMGKFAFAFLNMRLIVTALAQLVTKPEIFFRPEFLISLGGHVKYGSDLLMYIVSGLIPVYRSFSTTSPPNQQSVKETFAAWITEKDRPDLHLLLCTFSRTYLRFLAQCIPKYLTGVSRVLKAHARSPLERAQLQEIWDLGTHMPFKYADCELFIAEMDTAVRNAYTQGAVTAGRRADIEASLVTCEQHIPDELDSALGVLMEAALPKFVRAVDVGRLYFWDTSWLGIDNVGEALKFDIIRKTPLVKGMRLRVCRRCGALMEDLEPDRWRELPPMINHAARHCVCADYWILD